MSVTSAMGRPIVAAVALLMVPASGDFHRFCGIAATDEDAALAAAAHVAGPGNVWHFNWKERTPATPFGVEFMPMIKTPEWNVQTLPPPSTGALLGGWNEPDDGGEAGADPNLRQHPTAFAEAWTAQMTLAKSKGYTEFVGPAMAQDTCWLDYFLKACHNISGCKELVTYLGVHHYRGDCLQYVADPSYIGFRDDLSYVLTYYRLMEKYNYLGFNIKGLVWDELGCGGVDDLAAQSRYMEQWYVDTIVKVKLGDAAVINKIRGTPWVMPKGPNADLAGSYYVGMCRGLDGGPYASEDAVRALQSIKSVAWFGIHQNRNLLFEGGGLSALGHRYFEACSRVR